MLALHLQGDVTAMQPPQQAALLAWLLSQSEHPLSPELSGALQATLADMLAALLHYRAQGKA